MSAWAINTNYVDFPQLKTKKSLAVGEKGTLSIESYEKEISLTKNNKILIMRSWNNDLLFTNEGIINNLVKTTIIKPNLDAIQKAKKADRPAPRDKYQFIYNYSIEKVLDNNNQLNDLKYSLKSVDNFGKPQVHFQQQFRKLEELDFRTILNGYIYAARTVFGKLVNAIPRQNKLEFMLLTMDKFRTPDLSKIPLLDGIQFLNDYIDRRIISRGKLLVATENLINKKLSDIIDIEEVGFVNENNGNEKNLKAQAEIFKRIFDVQKNSDFLENVKRIIAQNKAIETHFDKAFKRQTWPIDLRI